MRTRSSTNNLGYEESESDESVYGRRLRKRKRHPLSRRQSHYRRSLNIEYQHHVKNKYLQPGNAAKSMPIRFTGKQHPMPSDMGREHQTGEEVEKKHLPMMSGASSSSNSQPYMNGNEAGSEGKMVRRSTRQRKFTYDNLNQTWLLAPGIADYCKYETFLSPSHRSPREGEECPRPIRRSERNRNHNSSRMAVVNSDSMEYDDMYSRVKRQRRKSAHEFYTRDIPQDGGSMADTEDTDRNELSDSDTIASEIEGEEGGVPQDDGTVNSNTYSLRPKKPITDRFQFPIEPVRPRRSNSSSIFEPPRHHRRSEEAFKSVRHRNSLFKRKKHKIRDSSSSTSSSDEDERHFGKRKARRNRNRCIPVNFMEEELSKGVFRDRMKIGANLADIDPMSIDKSVSFDSVGGLDRHIQALKEMILFPLMYPEVFEKFKISPPRGVLFHGPPGTGKTLVARALANECSNNDKQIAFFMRKGADCLSKWVGESERQLRLLFDQAYTLRPSIIFFDEIDGLAPVRSTRQDQIHSSIVSTLLALMDGLDNRGEIVIIGATNRIDAIDPALRRPGRFDREMLFPLPSTEARHTILKIHMQQWNPPQPVSLITQLANRSVGYCGADLKALCTESALVALRRRYPQIYGSRQKLQLDVNSIEVTPKDFLRAMRRMKPLVQRTSVFTAKPLPDILKPVLDTQFQEAVSKLLAVFPIMTAVRGNIRSNANLPANVSTLDVSSDESDSGTIEEPQTLNGPERIPSRYLWPFVHRPRLILSGDKGQGQGVLVPAILYQLEHIPVHRLDIPSLYAVTTKAPEEACAQIFQEAQRTLPSIIFLPHIGYWWETLSDTVRATFQSLLQDLEPYTPVLLLATSDCPFHQLPVQVRNLFNFSENQVLHMRNPNEECRKKFFMRLKQEILIPPKVLKQKESVAETLPVVPTPIRRNLTDEELDKLRQKEEATMRELRLFLRDTLNKLARDRRFNIFARPVDPELVPDYQEVIKNPMDLETMMSKIDTHQYETVTQFLEDIDLVSQNALEYNPDRDPSDKLIRHRACALKDIAHALILNELDDEFEKVCKDIHTSRKERGEANKNHIILPKPRRTENLLVHSESAKENANLPDPHCLMNGTDNYPTRFSKRIRGLGTLSENAEKEDPKRENFPVPKRSTRYVLWRRKKSPWFGGCRRKLIRRPIAAPNSLQRSKFKKCSKIRTFKSLPAVSPIQEATSSPKEEATISPTRTIRVENNPKSPATTKMSIEITNLDMNNVPLLSPKKCSPRLRSDKSGKPNNSPACDSNCDIFVGTTNNASLIEQNAKSPTPLAQSAIPVKEEEMNASSLSSPETKRKKFIHEQETNTAKKQVVINKDRLQSFFDRIVKFTNNYTVERLQHLFSTLHRLIYKHRKEWNKQSLLAELEEELGRISSKHS